MSKRALRLIGAPLAGAAALLACGLLLGIDPLVSAFVGALVWAGLQLVWPPEVGGPATGERLTATQVAHLDRAEAAVAEIHALIPRIAAAGVTRPLGEIAARAAEGIDRIQADPRRFGPYRKPLGSYLDQAAALARRYREAEAAGRAGADTAARAAATLDRLVSLYAAIEARDAADAAFDLDARIAVLETEVEAELARGLGAGQSADG